MEVIMEMSVASFLDNMVNREISNGIWFISNIFLLIYLIGFLTPRLKRNPVIWSASLDVKLVWGMTLIVIGSTIRSGWIWVLLVMQYYKFDDVVIKSISPITFVAIIILIWGTICMIKAMSVRNRWLWSAIAIVSVSVPFVVHYLREIKELFM